MFDQTGSGPEPIEPPKRNIGVPHHEIRDRLACLLAMHVIGGNKEPMLPMNSPSAFITAWFSSTLLPTATVRHARLMADVLARDRQADFYLGGADLARAGDFRRRYIDALRAADANDIAPFSRSHALEAAAVDDASTESSEHRRKEKEVRP